MPHTFVLVHGAWHGGWCWRRVADRLERLGPQGLRADADRSRAIARTSSKPTSASTRTPPTSPISCAGNDWPTSCSSATPTAAWSITEAAAPIGPAVSIDRLPRRVPARGRRQHARTVAALEGHGRRPPAPPAKPSLPPIPAAVFKVNEADRAWVDGQCTPQPAKTFTDRISAAAASARDKSPRKAYIRATATNSPWFDAALAKARRAGWRSYEVPCGHDVMVDMPDRLTEILLEVA